MRNYLNYLLIIVIISSCATFTRMNKYGELEKVTTLKILRRTVKDESITSDGQLVKGFYLTKHSKCLSSIDINKIKKVLRKEGLKHTNFSIMAENIKECQGLFYLSTKDPKKFNTYIKYPLLIIDNKYFVNSSKSMNINMDSVKEQLLLLTYTDLEVKSILNEYKKGVVVTSRLEPARSNL